MNRLWLSLRGSALAAAAGLAAAPVARADAVSVVQMLREGGCGGIAAAAPLLRHENSLDRAAEQWAVGRSLSGATDQSGYAAQSAQGLHLSGPDDSMIRLLRRDACRTVSGRELRDFGAYRRGADTWLVLASPQMVSSAPPATHGAPATSYRGPAAGSHPLATTSSPLLAARALQLVNQVRAHGTRCGGQSFGPAPALTLSGTLGGVALGHATDMAEHDYFEHQDLAGHSPADRVRAVGYQEKLVGENIAYGPESVEEAVRGWLDSPGHCQNIMDPRFAEMGIALATGRASRRGLFWVQVLAEPRA
jgi:uncharacterized protein YkwD